MVTYLSVCKNTIACNRKLPANRQTPVIRVSLGKHGRARRVNNLTITNPKRVSIMYNPDSPTPWGARAWVEIET